MKNSDKSDEKPQYTLKFEYDRPEDSAQALAIKLAEAFTKSASSQRDAEAFKTNAQSERVKAKQLRDVIFQLKERKKNPIPNVSRMDPLNEYDLEKCEAEFEECKTRAQNFQITSDTFAASAHDSRREAETLQRLIHQANKK